MNHFVSIQLDKKSKIPLYQQLGDALCELIQKGILKPNTKLPTIRTLASQLKINNATVVNAYKYLESKGVVYAQMGSGTYVSPLPLEMISFPVLPEKDHDLKLKQISISKNTINFANISPPTDLFPVKDFKEMFNEVLERDKGKAFNVQDDYCYDHLQESIADYLTTYGIHTSKDNIQIISDTQHGIDILSKTLLQFGDVIFVEKPAFYGTIAAFANRGARIVEIPLNFDGMDISLLEGCLKLYQPKFIYITPYFQNPTGYSYSLAKKKIILNLAQKYNTYIIEEDYVSDLNYSDKPIVPLKALDKQNRVIYIKNFSKVLVPGLRLGFLILPEKIIERILSHKHSINLSTSGLIQRVFDLYLRKGQWQKHLKKIRTIYEKRYYCLLDALEYYLKNYITYIPPQGGLSVWIKLADSISAANLCDLLLAKNVILSPGSLFSMMQDSSSYLRLGFATVDENQIEKGVKIMGDVLDTMLTN